MSISSNTVLYRTLWANPWLEAQDLIGKASFWPKNIRLQCWRSELKYEDRLHLVAFFFANGLPLDFFIAMIKFTNPNLTSLKLTKLRDLWLYIANNSNNCRFKYYSFDIIQNGYYYLNNDKYPRPGNNKM